MARTILSCLALGLATATPAGTVLGGVVGNVGTELCKALHRPVAKRWLEGRSGIDENRHVASALRLAQLASLRVVLSGFNEAWPADWDDSRRTEAGRFSLALQLFLEDETVSAKQPRFGTASPVVADERAIRDDVLASLPDVFHESCASVDYVALREGLAQLRSVTERSVLAEVRLRTVSVDRSLPGAFVQAFDGSGLADAWFDLFVRDAARRLKEDASLARAWDAEQLALVKAIAAAQREAREYCNLRYQLSRLTDDDPRVLALRQTAGEQIGAGDFGTADTTLSEAERLDIAAIEELESLAEQRRASAAATRLAEQRRVSAAATRAQRASTARLRLDYRAELAHYDAAAAIVARDERAALPYRLRGASAFKDLEREYVMASIRVASSHRHNGDDD